MHSSVMDRRHFILRPNKLCKPILSYNSVKIIEGVHLILLRNIFICLNQFENLISLTICSTIKYDVYVKCFYETENASEQSSVQLKLLKILKIKGMSSYLPYFLDVMPELVHLDIRLNVNKDNPRQKIYDYINQGKKRIKTLILYADDETNNLISSIEGMNLETFEIQNFRGSSNFTDSNKLLHIKLAKYTNSFCDYFPNIETLSSNDMTNMRGIEKFTKLKSLRGIQIYDETIDSLSEYGSKVLEKLWLQDQRSSNLLSFENLLNLTHLSFRCINLTDNQMQEICKNLKE